MDLTLLPYEILQLIASSLLPRHQCRLAMTSRHHYHYLYTDLLRWHAKNSRQRPPTHEIIFDVYIMTIICANNKMAVYRTDSSPIGERLVAVNFTENTFVVIECPRYRPTSGNLYIWEKVTHSVYTTYRGSSSIYKKGLSSVSIYNKYYKYIHKDRLLSFINLRTEYAKIRNLPYYIVKYLDVESIHTVQSCEHLSATMNI